MKVDVLIVGAGFAGCVIAQRFSAAGKTVLVIDKREHVGGNAYDEKDAAGVLVHRYGPHIFHTNARRVVDYLSQFTEWHPYEHKVLASVEGRLFPIPISRKTINLFYGLSLDEAGMVSYLENVRDKRHRIETSEDVVLNSVGRDLCDKFFRNYTRKQWGLELSQLSPAVAGRIPVRINDDDRYFTDSFQCMPKDGFAAMFTRMLDHPRIRLELGQSFQKTSSQVQANVTFYSGPVDEYFGFCYGKLPYRSLRFEHLHYSEKKQYQPVAVVNYPNEFEYTRVTEFKHMTGQEHSGTSIVREYPQDGEDPYYPIPTSSNQDLYQRYKLLLAGERNVHFVGRLAEYRYYNMDQVVAAALKLTDQFLSIGKSLSPLCEDS